MQLQLEPREVTLKLVYYGPGLSGKTTNLSQLHKRIQAVDRGRLFSLDTADDRTLFFDMLPLCIGNSASNDSGSGTSTSNDAGSFAVRLKLYTVPGQSIHAATRRLVLNGADGVAFIADSRSSHIETNAESFTELKDNLDANALDLAQLPLVIQFNKRDLADIRSDAELDVLARRSAEPVYPAVASRGEGVVETFLALLQRTWSVLEERHELGARIQISEKQVIEGAAEQLDCADLEATLARRFGGAGVARGGAS